MYNNPKEFIKVISELAEQIEYFKLILTQKEQVSDSSFVDIEKSIESNKLNIVKYLTNKVNYQEWKDENNNNELLLTRYIKDGYFDNEIGFDGLKDRILIDFSEKYEKVKDTVLTLQEKKRIEYQDKNNVPTSNRGFSQDVINYVRNIHNKEFCFKRKLEQFDDLLPTRVSSISKEFLSLIKKYPIVLKDHPNHYYLNRPGSLLRTTTINETLELVRDSSMGDSDATDSLTLLLKKAKELLKGKSIEDVITEVRKISKEQQFKNNQKNKIN
jgi:hypothetical protein